jgi:hypothetical protein
MARKYATFVTVRVPPRDQVVNKRIVVKLT